MEDLFLSFFGPGPGEALWMMDGPWRFEYTVQTSMTEYFWAPLSELFCYAFIGRFSEGVR